jgi:NADPH:quinone reductase-like Zn-dependent oxidoreductase
VITPNVVPGSDGAGQVVSIGKSVKTFKEGDKVVTHLVPSIAFAEAPTFAHISAGLGHAVDGTVREYGVFNEDALVRMPKNLSFEQASTLTCSGLTAWNALFGGGKKLGKGNTVLTQGTGGVSVAALQVSALSLSIFFLIRGRVMWLIHIGASLLMLRVQPSSRQLAAKPKPLVSRP